MANGNPLHVGTSPITNRIFAGNVLKDGLTWAANKQDVTGAACGAVAEHVLANGGPVTVTCNGKPKFEIIVRDLEAAPAAPAKGQEADRKDAERLDWLDRNFTLLEGGIPYGSNIREAIDDAMAAQGSACHG